jgi:hypothetical protein
LVRQELLSGAISQILLVVFAVLNIFASFLFFEVEFILLGIVAYLFFLVFSALFLFSAYMMRSQLGGSPAGILGSICGVAASLVALLVNTMFGKVGYHYVYLPLGITFLLWIPILVFTGLTMVLIGATFITYRQEYFPIRLWIAVGVLYIVAGSFEFTIFLSFIGDMLAIVSGALGSVCLFTSTSSRDDMVAKKRIAAREKVTLTAGFVLCLVGGIIESAISCMIAAMSGFFYTAEGHGGMGAFILALLVYPGIIFGIVVIVCGYLGYSGKGRSPGIAVVVVAPIGLVFNILLVGLYGYASLMSIVGCILSIIGGTLLVAQKRSAVRCAMPRPSKNSS